MKTDPGRQNSRNTGAARPQSVRELMEQSERVRQDLIAVMGALRQVTRGGEGLLRDRLERRPYATLAVAAGVGYVLGGGIPSGLVRLLLGLTIEHAVTRFATSQAGA